MTKRYLQEYELLKKKYKLPGFEELDKEFDLTAFFTKTFGDELPPFILRDIRRSMVERFYSMVNYLHGLVYPNQGSLINMNEYQYYADEDRKLVQAVLAEIMYFNRLSIKLEIYATEADEARFINDAFKMLAKVKGPLTKIIDKNIQGWDKNRKSSSPLPQERSSYHG